MPQRNSEHLVRPATHVIACLAVHDVIEIAAVVIPEPGVERRVRRLGHCVSGGVDPVYCSSRTHCAVICSALYHKGIDLDRLAAPRRHHPIADLGIHPGKLIAFGPLPQQAILRIDADPEAGALPVMLDDIDQLRQQFA